MNMQETKDISPYRQRLKTRIIETAMAAFAEKGVRAVKMDDVASTLSISKRTLYEIYATKEVLLCEGLKVYAARREKDLTAATKDCRNVMEILLTIYKRKIEGSQHTSIMFYKDVVKYPMALQFLKDQNEHNRELSQQFIKRGIQEGYFRSDLDYKLAGRLFEILGKYIMDNQLYEIYSIQELFHNLMFVSLRGVCTEKGVVELDRIMKG